MLIIYASFYLFILYLLFLKNVHIFPFKLNNKKALNNFVLFIHSLNHSTLGFCIVFRTRYANIISIFKIFADVSFFFFVVWNSICFDNCMSSLWMCLSLENLFWNLKLHIFFHYIHRYFLVCLIWAIKWKQILNL